ncbi:MAG TPA: helix-turn-helix domain-containing protein [Bacteroidia bacterium]|nr:helix-turn-helix domain-containing protein [Bacteroidia bacterium]
MTEKEYHDLVRRLDEINQKLSTKVKSMENSWIDNSEFLQLLKISRRTAQSYRDNNMIAFSIIGNKIFYRMSDVEDLLNRHYQKRLI